MRKTILVLIILSFFINSCCINKITLEEKEEWNKEIYGEEPFLKNQIPPVKINLKEFYDYDGYIFPKEYDSGWKKKFTPTIVDIKKAEIILSIEHNSLSQFKNVKFRKWYRQYIGYYNSHNKKVIEIYFLKLRKGCIGKS
ncbi:MAG: hypothetical protein L3J23_08975 [Flavobacteriaceae bacterium]|nr:hypothetical protein [Flavobacteriaceae bacterium]